MASISKVATARATNALALQRALQLDGVVTEILPWTNPPSWLSEHPVTVRQFLSHTSGLPGLARYLPDPGQSIMSFIEDHLNAVFGRAPGSYFAFANLKYILLSHVMEVATVKRFDHILRDKKLRPAGIAGRCNWTGVPLMHGKTS